MTEAEWLTATDPAAMLELLRGKTSDRKLRLFAAACFGRLTGPLSDPRQRRGIEVLGQFAEGTVTMPARREVTAEVRRAIPADDRSPERGPTDHRHYVALMLYREFCSRSVGVHAVQATAGLADAAGEKREQARLMRCIFGNPFQPVAVDPSWRTEAVVALAGQMYESRDFGPMPVLADALEDAGCANADVLGHCRGPGPHVRGCWVVDLILGKS